MALHNALTICIDRPFYTCMDG